MNRIEIRVEEGDVVLSGLSRSMSLIIGPAKYEVVIDCVTRWPLKCLSDIGVYSYILYACHTVLSYILYTYIHTRT